MQTNTEMRAVHTPPATSSQAPPLLEPRAVPELPRPSAGHRRMAAFLGEWVSDGHARPSPFDPTVPASAEPLPVRRCGTHRGEWLSGGFFLIHRFSERVGGVASRGLWVMGFDAGTQVYPIHLFDDAGNAVAYRATVSDQTWTITGRMQRALITFADDGATMRQRWWIREGTAWVPLCDLTSRRA